MKEFVIIYMAPLVSLDTVAKATPEEQQADMQSWQDWMRAHEADFVDQGSPLSHNIRVTKGHIDAMRNEVCGYGIVKAKSHQAAAELMQDSPHFDLPGAYIEVLEKVEM